MPHRCTIPRSLCQQTAVTSLLWMIFVGLASIAWSAEANFSTDHIEFFEAKVRPLLSTHCYECHSSRAKTVEGGLRLDARPLVLAGGDSGAVVVPGKPNES